MLREATSNLEQPLRSPLPCPSHGFKIYERGQLGHFHQVEEQKHVSAYADRNSLPIFGDVKRPLKGEVSVVVIVNEAADSVIVASCYHAARGLF